LRDWVQGSGFNTANLEPYRGRVSALILIIAKVLAQGRSLTVAALLVGSTVRSQQSRDRQGALRDPNLQILLQRLIFTVEVTMLREAKELVGFKLALFEYYKRETTLAHEPAHAGSLFPR